MNDEKNYNFKQHITAYVSTDEISQSNQSSKKSKNKWDTSKYLTLRNIQYSLPPVKEICNLTVSTFEKMTLQHLRTLEQLNKELIANGKISVDAINIFAMTILTQVWKSNGELINLLKSDPLLTQMVGKELMVLFDNVMSEPVYKGTKNGKPQRYTKACLDSSIKPIFEDKIPKNRINTYETVISTYTSPKAFTPEVESLVDHARSLGISTDYVNLKSFATERSLAAFLKTSIQAKIKKKTFIKNFVGKVWTVLHHSPEIDNNTLHKFKYSFGKLSQFAQSNPNFTAINYKKSNDIKNFYKKRISIPAKVNGNLANSDSKEFITLPSGSNRTDTICRECHGPYGDRYSYSFGTVKSKSDSCLSLASCDIISCKCFDNARKSWGASNRLTSKPNINFPQTLWKSKKNSNIRSILKPPDRHVTNRWINEPEGLKRFDMLTEQRSFFTLGDGALRDCITGYIQDKNEIAESARNRQMKRVRWIDELSLSSVFESLLGKPTDLFNDCSMVPRSNLTEVIVKVFRLIVVDITRS